MSDKMSQEEIEKVLNTTDEEIAKMSSKEKQKYFKNKTSLVKVVYRNAGNNANKPYRRLGGTK